LALDGAVQAEMDKARRLMDAGARDQASAIYRQLVRRHGADAGVLRRLGAAQTEIRDCSGARETLERALKLAPADVRLLTDVARTWLVEGRLSETMRAVDRALRLAPGHGPALQIRAHALILSGDHAAAWEAIRPVVEAGNCDASLASSLARVARRVGQRDRAVEVIRRHLDSPDLGARVRAELLFRLGELHDSCAEWDLAFAAFEEGNRLQRSQFRFDVAGAVAAIDAVIEAWGPGMERSSVRSERPLFILGMPRSGTSLVEQVLASHPAVAAGGELQEIAVLVHRWQGGMEGDLVVLTRPEELTVADLDSAARAYLEALRRIGPSAARVTDKLPINFLNLGLISSMLPGARVVHCTRDPMDTCLSCYFQNFQGFVPFAYDLRELGVFYRAYQRLMAHWERVIEAPLQAVRYEQMVNDQERVTRELVAFAGLPWDDRCLRFHENRRVVLTSSNEQVRRPMYASSVERWRNYEKHLGPLREALGI
jgi:tetratricopeptide (TPR) repeat protein